MKVVDEKKSMGDSGAAETCSHETTFLKFHCNFLQDHNEEHGFIAANGTRMENLGQKRIEFEAKNDVKNNILFQVSDSRKSFASVSKIVARCTTVVFAPDRS